MKKINLLIICIFSFFTLISCKSNAQSKLEELIKNTNKSIITAKYEINIAVDEIKTDLDDKSQRTDHYSQKNTVELDYIKHQAIILQDYSYYYYFNGYLSNGYNSQPLTWDELMNNSQVSPSINKNVLNLKSSISKKNQDGCTIIEISLKDSDIKKILSVDDYNFDDDITLSKYKIIIESTDSKIINKTTISFSYTNKSYYYSYDGDVEITSSLVSKNINVKVPLEIVESIRENIDENYSGPRGYHNYLFNPYKYRDYPSNIDSDTNLINDEAVEYRKITSSSTKGFDFDPVSNLFYSANYYTIVFYSYNDLSIVFQKPYNSNFYVAEGMLFLLNDSPYRIEVYNLKTFALMKTSNLPDDFYPLVFAGNKLVMSMNNTQCDYYFENGTYSTFTKKIPSANEYLYDKVTKRIFACSYNELYSIDPLSYSFTTASIASSYLIYSQVKSFYLTSKGIHISQRIYDYNTLQEITNYILTDDYYTMINFIPREVLYIDDQYTVLLGYSNARNVNTEKKFYYCMAIYNNITKKYIFKTYSSFYKTTRNNNDFIAIPYANSLSFICIKENKLVNPLDDQIIDDYIVDNNNEIKYLHQRKVVSDVVCNESYIFAFDNENNINVYDINSLLLVQKIDLIFNPTCFDVYENTLVVGFGQQKQFAIINTATWNVKMENCEINILQIAIFKDKIIINNKDYWAQIYIFNINKKTFETLRDSYSVAEIAIDKKDGVLYIGETGNSGSNLYYYNLKTDSFIYKSSKSFSYGFGLRCDNYNVFYYGLIFDKRTGERYLEENYLPLFPKNNTYNYLGCIFYNGTYSVVIASKGDLIYTLVYNKSKNIIKEIPFIASNVLETNENLIVYANYYNTIAKTKK